MQFKMLNEILEVSISLQTGLCVSCEEPLLKLLDALQVMSLRGDKMTPKEKRVLNALQTVVHGEEQRKKRGKRIKQVCPPPAPALSAINV